MGTNFSAPTADLDTAFLAAKGAIALGSIVQVNQAHVIDHAQGNNAAAIDAIFTDKGRQLVIDPLDFGDLDLILADLASLQLDQNNNLTGPTP